MDRQYKLLIVDDENVSLEIYSDYFKKRGYIVAVAENGIEGLDKLRQDEFDAAIVDIQMPKMNGIEMIKRMREEGIDTDTIILTGHGDREDAITALNLGVSAWFEKSSIDMNKLRQRVEEICEIMPLEEVRQILSAIPDKE